MKNQTPVSAISYREIESSEIDIVRGMCENLMRFQAEKAIFRQDVLKGMNFNNRFLPDYEAAIRKSVVVAFADDQPAGFVFAAVSDVTGSNINMVPGWASDLDGTGFYPEDYDVPKRVGTFKLLFVETAYRGQDVGQQLSDRAMVWLKSHHDVEDLWVFVANGNEQVGKFYQKYGFVFSHSVFNGFIDAYRHKV